MADNYYEEIDKNLKKQVDIALADIDMQERVALQKLSLKREASRQATLNEMNSAYTGYLNAANPYGVNSEALYASGLGDSGKSETAKSAYYAAYTDLLGKLKAASVSEQADYDMQESDIMANALSGRTDVQLNAYNNMLAEIRRRADDEWERQKYADTLAAKERELLLKEAQAEYDRQKDERDYAFKADNEAFDRELALRSLSLKGVSSSNKSKKSEDAKTVDEQIKDDPYNMLLYIFESLNSSVLPGEDNPGVRIARAKNSYLEVYKNLLSDKEYKKLKSM